MTPHDALVARLRERLAGPLPGHAAHAEMAPFPSRLAPDAISVEGKTGRKAATLVLLYPDDAGRSLVVLTARHADLRAHSGQVSLPGGAIETGETPEQAALREAEEEVGVDRTAPELLGRLTPIYVPPSGFSVWPVVASLPDRPDFRASVAEVAAVVEVPVAVLLDPATRRTAPRRVVGGPLGPPAGTTFDVPFFAVPSTAGPLEVWGATAMMLAEFVAVARDAAGPVTGG